MFDFFNNLKENEIKDFSSGNFKKLIRIQKKLRIKTKDMEVDDIFRDLETTRDKDGNIIDTRFDEETQAFIRNFLAAKKCLFL